MKRMISSLIVAALVATAVPASAQPSIITQPFNEKLGWIGLTTMMAGGMLMIPYKDRGAEDYTVGGIDYCITNQRAGKFGSTKNVFDVQRGACATSTPLIKAGLVTIGAGAVMTWLGFHKVNVTFGAHSAAANVVMNW